MKDDMVRTRITLMVEVSREDWHRDNPGESDAHIKAFLHENVRLVAEAFVVPHGYRINVENVNFPKRGWFPGLYPPPYQPKRRAR